MLFKLYRLCQRCHHVRGDSERGFKRRGRSVTFLQSGIAVLDMSDIEIVVDEDNTIDMGDT